jgi:Arc/MetJ-type ribon-helix-helix transcriptional regulator
MDTIERTIRLSEQDRAAITAIREQYGLTSDSEAIRFALHTMWREIQLQRNPTQASQPVERHFHPAP